MKRRLLAFSVAFCLAACSVQAAGLRFIHIPEEHENPAIDAAVWSPCAKASENMQVGQITVKATPECHIDGEGLPLIVISHGYGGWYLGHRDTAEALADAGFVVIAINHPHANYADMSKGNGLPALISRPLDIKRTIDFMLTSFPDASKIDPERIGFYGFSQGGYTGLVLAGATPDFSKLPPRCDVASAVDCLPVTQRKPFQGLPQDNTLAHDDRIKAMVVSDPLSVVFQTEESVRNIHVPLQVWASEHGDARGASFTDVRKLVSVLPKMPEFQVVPQAIHMSFLTMCPESRRSSEVCVDAPGFDRAAFHKTFNAQVIKFFERNLNR